MSSSRQLSFLCRHQVMQLLISYRTENEFSVQPLTSFVHNFYIQDLSIAAPLFRNNYVCLSYDRSIRVSENKTSKTENAVKSRRMSPTLDVQVSRTGNLPGRVRSDDLDESNVFRSDVEQPQDVCLLVNVVRNNASIGRC